MSDISTAIDPSMLLERDRSRVCAAVNALDDVVRSYSHLSEPGRGPYAWDDERYQREFGLALNAIEVALKPLRTIARDWSGCPTDPEQVKAARALPLTTRLAPDRTEHTREALECAERDLSNTYEAAKSGKPLVISIGQFQRLDRIRESLAALTPEQ